VEASYLVTADEPRAEWVVFEVSQKRAESHRGVCKNCHEPRDGAPSLMNELA
jgi:hypothetical protein